jgi:hypothetical protein
MAKDSLGFNYTSYEERELAKLEHDLAEARKAAEWISVDERLPEKGHAHNWLVWVKCDNGVGGYVELAAYGDYFYEDEDANPDDPNYVDGNDPFAEEGNMRGTGWHREEETHGGQYDSVMVDLNNKVTHWKPKPIPPAPEEKQPEDTIIKECRNCRFVNKDKKVVCGADECMGCCESEPPAHEHWQHAPEVKS